MTPEPSFRIVDDPDVLLIGSGVLSAHLGALLKRLDPGLRVQVYEQGEGLARESSDGWNNAGTGHAGLCELSYTPGRRGDGSVDVGKVIEIFEQFEHSKQFWSHAVESGMVEGARDFIRPLPHISFVHGEEQVDFLKARHAGMAAHPFFDGLRYSTDREEIGAWAPLLVEGRGEGPVAATWIDGGTDVDFGEIARKLLYWLGTQEGCGVAAGQRVIGLDRAGSGWDVRVEAVGDGEVHRSRARFVFVGAGGGSLALLQKAGLAEAKGLGGFPIGGQWLICEKEEIVERHHAKVYGQALDAAPTMAVPHLDTRVLDGQKRLLFGPFAAWTTRFLRHGGRLSDLPRSIRPDNLGTLVRIGLSNLDLVKYLFQQGRQSMEERMEVLRVFYPAAQASDWRLIDAGIRVQAIKKSDGKAGIVHYGTEVITDEGGSLSALLGASPGASVSVSIALDVIRRCFPGLLDSAGGRERMRQMVPTFDEDIKELARAERYRQERRRYEDILGLRPGGGAVVG